MRMLPTYAFYPGSNFLHLPPHSHETRKNNALQYKNIKNFFFMTLKCEFFFSSSACMWMWTPLTNYYVTEMNMCINVNYLYELYLTRLSCVWLWKFNLWNKDALNYESLAGFIALKEESVTRFFTANMEVTNTGSKSRFHVMSLLVWN